MQSDCIETLKKQYTDRYVVADASRAELARFKDMVGQIKTINWSGRALVQFDADSNRGWYDIDLGCLKVVDKPEPKAAAVKPAAAAKAVVKKDGAAGGADSKQKVSAPGPAREASQDAEKG
jgi:hypothetical protein